MFPKSMQKIILLLCAFFLFSKGFHNPAHGRENISDPKILELKKKAEAGDTDAQSELGLIYWYGDGVKQNKFKAVVWMEEAAVKGANANAENYLGIAYTYGAGGKKRNVAEAFEWFEKSALHGDSYGQANLGHFYYRGIGVKTDCKQAKYWLEQSVLQNSDEGERSLAYLYENGRCVEKNTALALDLYQKSCSHGNKASCYYYEALKSS